MSTAPTDPATPAAVEAGNSVPTDPATPVPAAGNKRLAVARDILLIIGVITIVMNAVYFVRVERLVDEEIARSTKAPRANHLSVDEARHKLVWDRTMATTRATTVAAIAVGALFVVLGLLVHKLPVTITIASLAIYLGGAAVRGHFDPQAPMQETVIIASIALVLALAILAAISSRHFSKER